MWPALPKVEQMTDNKREGGAGLSPIEDVIAAAAAGKLFILVDDEDRENEGDLTLAAETKGKIVSMRSKKADKKGISKNNPSLIFTNPSPRMLFI